MSHDVDPPRGLESSSTPESKNSGKDLAKQLKQVRKKTAQQVAELQKLDNFFKDRELNNSLTSEQALAEIKKLNEKENPWNEEELERSAVLYSQVESMLNKIEENQEKLSEKRWAVQRKLTEKQLGPLFRYDGIRGVFQGKSLPGAEGRWEKRIERVDEKSGELINERNRYKKLQESLRANQKRQVLLRLEQGLSHILIDYAEFSDAIIEEEHVITELIDRVIEDEIRPALKESVEKGKISEEDSENFLNLLEDYFMLKNDPDQKDKFNEVKIKLVKVQNYGYDYPRSSLSVFLDNYYEKILERVVSDIAFRDIELLREQIRVNVHGFFDSVDLVIERASRTSKRSLDSQPSWFQAKRFDSVMMVSFPSNFTAFRHIKESGTIRVFLGDTLKALDEQIYQYALDDSLTDGYGGPINLLAHYPTPEAFRNIVLMAAASDLGKQRESSWEALKVLRQRDDWNTIFDHAANVYPQLEEVRGVLEKFDLEAYRIYPEIDFLTESFALAVLADDETTEDLRSVASQAVPSEHMASLLVNLDVVKKDEINLINESIGALRRSLLDSSSDADQEGDEETSFSLSGDYYYYMSSIKNVTSEILVLSKKSKLSKEEEKKLASLKSQFTRLSWVASEITENIKDSKRVKFLTDYYFLRVLLNTEFIDSDKATSLLSLSQSLSNLSMSYGFMVPEGFIEHPEIFLSEGNLNKTKKLLSIYKEKPHVLNVFFRLISDGTSYEWIEGLAQKAPELLDNNNFELFERFPKVFLLSPEALVRAKKVLLEYKDRNIPIGISRFLHSRIFTEDDEHIGKVIDKHWEKLKSLFNSGSSIFLLTTFTELFIDKLGSEKYLDAFGEALEIVRNIDADTDFWKEHLSEILGVISNSSIEVATEVIKLTELSNGLDHLKLLSFLTKDNLIDMRSMDDYLLFLSFIEKVGFVHLEIAFEMYKYLISEEKEDKPEVLKNLNIPEDKYLDYIFVFRAIDSSQSQEIQLLKDQLIDLILQLDDPKGGFKKIEDIFVKNNLPMVGKVYKIFDILHPPDLLQEKLNRAHIPSLLSASDRRRRSTIYKDLLDIHIKSGNRSLRSFLITLEEGESVLKKYEENKTGLSSNEIQQLESFLDKLDTLYDNSLLGRRNGTISRKSIDQRVQDLRESLGVGDDQTIIGRLSEMFLKPLGYKSFDEALEKMESAKKVAHERGINYAATATDGYVELNAGDLVKKIESQYFEYAISQNGSVAKEFLGSGASSDGTPLDTDLNMVLESDLIDGSPTEKFQSASRVSMSYNYGDLGIVVKDRDQFNKTDSTTSSQPIGYRGSELELFKTGVMGERHYGIRTGFPTTEIDFMVAPPGMIDNERRLQDIKYTIAQNGFFIPIVDQTGKIIFSPEDYRELRSIFAGVEEYGGDPYELANFHDNIYLIDIGGLKQEIANSKRKVEKLSTEIRSIITSVLDKNGVTLRKEFETGILGAELGDTGSTGRNTNIPRDYDFDLMLTLDDSDFEKAPQIREQILERLQPQENKSHADSEYIQIRAIGVSMLDEEVDIDIGIRKKSERRYFGTHDAISAKLEWISENKGEQAHSLVLANIVWAKKLLKEGEAYKRVEEGGMGGVGVETLVLAYGGSAQLAFKAFHKAAYQGRERVSLEVFRKRFKLIDAGTNVKFGRHDNFVYNMTEKGYNKMLDVIEEESLGWSI